MSELKACPFCGNQSAVMDWLPSLSGIVEYPFCEYCGAQCETAELWNTRPIEDGMRSQVDAMREHYHQMSHQLIEAQAEIEQLRGIIRTAEYADRYGDDEDDTPICPLCGVSSSQEHQYFCPFYQWEGGAQ